MADDSGFPDTSGDTGPNDPNYQPPPGPPATRATVAQIAAWYKQYLGRDPGPGEAAPWATGGLSPAAVEAAIKGSPEAKAYTAAHPAGGGTTTPTTLEKGSKDHDAILAQINSWASKTGANPSLKADPEYWIKRIQDTGGWDEGYWTDRFMQAEGAPEGGGGNSPNLASPFIAPWTTPFNYQPWQPPPAFKPPADFVAPTDVTEQNDPGYKFRLDQGQQAIEHSAAAKGTLLGGGTLKDLASYEQGLASQEYGAVYGRALQDWTSNYNKALTDYATTYNADLTDWTTNYNGAMDQYKTAYNIFENNQGKLFNRTASLAGLGQTAAGQLGGNSLGFTQLGANTLNNLGAGAGDLATQKGNAQAGGVVGGANAFGGLFGNASSLAQLYGMGGLNKTSYGN